MHIYFRVSSINHPSDYLLAVIIPNYLGFKYTCGLSTPFRTIYYT